MATPPSGVVDLPALGFVVTSIVTVVGWFTVAKMTDARDFRKEVRELVSDCRGNILDVIQSARDYWLGNVADDRASHAVSLKANLLALSRQLELLEHVGLAVDTGLLVAVRQAATSGDFEKKGRRKSAADTVRIGELAYCAQDLMSAINLAFYYKYPPPSKSSRWLRWIPFGGIFLMPSDSR
ncbi:MULTISPECIES: hypothetical protein [Sphingobium]|uniref:hypothetical protein n=1 Tax=Sphingobium TaxID=165695 RepID=UPI0015EC8EE6|nr:MULTISPECIES: hypothetical protein [Sphingobium]MCW2361638.1 hypothetical protein [Sphingobium sp. B10D3B]MCW2401683.1 hypothetical protein [Sphingobium sp. B10D7B]MCW2408663.1 hypothetical protein [Sphingobium xanthum]